ncbi:MAG: class I SAM-dependent methyltransferase, partial [Acidimicrobiales bacterium]
AGSMQPTGSDRPRVEATTAAAAAAAASQGEAPEGEAPEAEAPPPTYRFAFSWEGPYGKAVNLVEAHAPPGAILDLGCGYGAVAEVLSEKGRDYIGADADGVALADLGVRGFETHEIDLCSGDLGARLKDVVAGRALGAVLLLDALEHLPEPEALLASLADFMVSANPGAPPPVLVASIPNVAHLDLAAKLVAGLWDVTPSGLLDRTHLQLFTEDRVTGELARHGFAECGRSDVVLERSDQHFPPDHPYLVEGGPVHEHLRALRAAAGPNMTVNQFVRAYTVGEGPRTPPSVVAPPLRKPLLSILTRTQGSRPSMLAETLTCLAAQSFEDFEVLLLVHGDDPGVLANCRDLVGRFDEGFSSRVR